MSSSTSCDPVPRMPERPPGVEDLDALGLERQREVKDRRPVLRVVVHAGGHQQVAGGDAAARRSCGRSCDSRRRPSPACPSRPASPSRRWTRGSASRPRPAAASARAPCCPSATDTPACAMRCVCIENASAVDAAVTRELADHRAQLGVGGISASELGRDTGRERATLAKRVVVFSDERIVLVVLRRPRREVAAERGHEGRPICGRGHGVTPGVSGHDTPPERAERIRKSMEGKRLAARSSS